MGRNHLQAASVGKNQGTKAPKKMILFVEGRNTEPSYFDLLRRSNCKVMPVTVTGRGIGSCVGFVREADKRFNSMLRVQREKYVQQWLVYDCDGHADFAESVKLARECGFRVAFSNMYVEYWFALHFFALDGSAIPMKGKSHS